MNGSRIVKCVMCDRAIVFATRTSPNPEAPEMLWPSPEAWIGFTAEGGTVTMIAACSQECCDKLFISDEVDMLLPGGRWR